MTAKPESRFKFILLNRLKDLFYIFVYIYLMYKYGNKKAYYKAKKVGGRRYRHVNYKSKYMIKNRHGIPKHIPIGGRLTNKLQHFKLVYSQYEISRAAGYDLMYVTANGMYDPNLSIGGKQASPIGFTDAMSQYLAYQVEYARIKVIFRPDPTNLSLTPHYCGVMCVDPTMTAPSGYNEGVTLLEDTVNNKHKMFPVNATGAGCERTVTMFFNARKFNNRKKDLDYEDQGTVTTNPINLVNFIVYVSRADTTSISPAATIPYVALIQVDYYASFSNPLAQKLQS